MALVNTIILSIIMAFMVIGAIDRILNEWQDLRRWLSRHGLAAPLRAIEGAGKQFEEGFMTMGALGLAMVGVIALAPVLAKILGPIVIPLYEALGASPAMFATTLLANDMGGYFLAKELATTQGVVDNAAWLYAGLILGAMMGPTIVFSIPVAIGIIDPEDRHYLALGVLAGMVTIPIGCLAGGLVAKYSGITVQGQPVDFPLSMLLINLIPVTIVSLLIILGLWLVPNKLINGFQIFAKILITIITISLAAAVLQTTLSLTLIPYMDPIFMTPNDIPGQVMRAMEVIGYIACVLLGAYPLVFLLSRWCEKPLLKLGKLFNVNSTSAAGFIATLANNIPMFGMLNKMDPRGKILNMAFMVSAAFTFGDHLGFTAANMPNMIFAVITGKLVGGLSALLVASFYGGSTPKPPPKERAPLDSF